MIDVSHLSVTFPSGVHAIDDASVTFPTGKITSLIGPSGCGKTTLLRVIAGLQAPTSGEVKIDGKIAFVFQTPALLPWRTTIENVMLPLELSGRPQRNIAMEMLQTVSLADAADRYPSELSGGMRMRVSLARALVTEPSVLLLDEPFAALDDMLRNQLGQLLLELWESKGFTAVMVTHNIAEASLISHEIHVMQQGRMARTIDNTLPWPRTDLLRRSSAFGAFYGTVSDELVNSRLLI